MTAKCKFKQEAKQKGEMFYYNGVICKRGHLSKRRTLDGCCVECTTRPSRRLEAKNRANKHYEDNREDILGKQRKKYNSDDGFKSKVCGRNLEYAKEHREEARERSRLHYISDTDPYKENAKRWRKENPEKYALCQGRRRHFLTIGCPVWANQEAIKQIYLMRDRMNLSEKGKYEVDHMIPLLNSNVCGLHNEFNLQILPTTENRQKSNKFLIQFKQ
jgi:hypothetical protein